MRKFLFFLLFLFYSGFAVSSTVTIINVDYTFSPDDVTIYLGDTVVFDITDIHNAVEVSEATWNANGTSPLAGGFAVPLGGGVVTDLSVGTHYYVCQPHASIGMKGKITVMPASGIADPGKTGVKFDLYPNPTKGNVYLEINKNSGQAGNLPVFDQNTTLSVYNLVGKKVMEIQQLDANKLNTIDLAGEPAGIYFIRIYDRKYTFTGKVTKQ